MHNPHPDIFNKFSYDDEFAFNTIKASLKSIAEHCEEYKQPIPKLTLVAITNNMVMPAGIGQIKPETIRKAAAALLDIADEQEEKQNV